MNNIKFSIIVPVYNVEKYIKKCINSILNQIYKNYIRYSYRIPELRVVYVEIYLKKLCKMIKIMNLFDDILTIKCTSAILKT